MNNNQLVSIINNKINGKLIHTVNARELHKFLEVKTAFKDWIVRRIKEYGFIEGQDFVIVLLKNEQNLQGGRPAKECHITLDMAKELSMVEKNEKGKQARRYFIDCEKQLRNTELTHTPNSLSSIFKAFRKAKVMAESAGFKKNQAVLFADRVIKELTGTSCLDMLGINSIEMQRHICHSPGVVLSGKILLNDNNNRGLAPLKGVSDPKEVYVMTEQRITYRFSINSVKEDDVKDILDKIPRSLRGQFIISAIRYHAIAIQEKGINMFHNNNSAQAGNNTGQEVKNASDNIDFSTAFDD